jgi:DNA-binding transcriptional MerR regulator
MVTSTNRRSPAEYVNSKRAAAILGVQKDTLIKWISRGRISPPERNPSNGYYRWKLTDLEVIRKLLMDKEMSS